MPVYTLGDTKIYRRELERCKQGKLPFGKRAGGSVWRTPEDAQAWLDANGYSFFSVWEVDADWDKDTVNGGEEWNDLTRDALILREVS